MNRIFVAASLATVSLFAASPATAQVPWTVEGQLQNGDDQDGEHRFYDVHAVLLTAGQRYRITVVSPEGGFDTTLQVLRPGSLEPLAQNDDDGSSLNSRLAFTPDRSGVYLVRVSSFAASGRGAYTARVEAQPPLPPPITAAPTSTATTTWRIWDGALGENDPDNDGRRYDDYLIHLAAGTHVISLDATGAEPFDTLLQIFRADAREGEPLASDDDGGRNLNSMLVFEAEREGDYVVRATSFGTGTAGPYRLRVGD
jgi:hypothetical protein